MTAQKIHMVDLVGQYQDLKSEIDAAIADVLSAGQYIGGRQVSALEEALCRYTGAQACVTCGNGTDALVLAMRALEIGTGDEVIVPDYTFAAPAEAAALVGAKPVFADVSEATMLIDPTKVEALITPRTKAIVAVHLFGQCCDMDVLQDIARRHGLYLIEDGAQALGSRFTGADGVVRQALTMGTIGCTSFFPTKNLGCYGDGGAVLTNDSTLADRVRCIAHHGTIRKYHHEQVGTNSRLDTLQAAILLAKLPHLDAHIGARMEAAARYDRMLSGIEGITIPQHAPHSTHTYHQYVIRIEGDRDAIRQGLSEQGIPTMIYYPETLHTQPAYGGTGASDEWVSDRLCRTTLALPMHTQLTEQQQNHIVCHLSDLIRL